MAKSIGVFLEGMKIWDFEKKKKGGMNISFYLFHFLPFKFLNKGMYFPFSLLKLPNNGNEK